MSTVRVPPPRNKTGGARKGSAKGRTGGQEVRSWLFRYRYHLWPFWVMLVVLLVALIINDALWLTLIYLVPAALIAAGHVALLRLDPAATRAVADLFSMLRLGKLQLRAYAVTVLAVAGAWSLWSLVGGWRALLSLPFVTLLTAWPWLKRASKGKTIPITFSPDLKPRARARAQADANRILGDWPVITRQGRIQFSELDGLDFTGSVTSVDVTLRGGQAIRSLTYPAMQGALESAFHAPAGSLRVKGRGRQAREVRMMFVMEDVNAEPLGAPPPDVDNMGRFEIGGWVEYVDGVHTVIVGANGSGKSVLMNRAILRKARKPEWAIVGIDLKPGALEFTPLSAVLACLVDRPDRVMRVLNGLMEEMIWRGGEMKSRGLRQWPATADHPNICLAIDEVQELHQVKGAMAILIRLAQLGRAFGFELVLATQFPKDSNLPSDIMAQIRQVFCCRLNRPSDDRVVFGETATAQGWTPSAIPDGKGGVFYVKSATYQEPIRARGWFQTPKEVIAEAESLGRTVLSRPWVPALPGHEVVSGPETAYQLSRADEYPEDVVDAVVVSEDPVETVVELIRAGHGTPDAIVDALRDAEGKPTMSKRAVNNIILDLANHGRIAREGSRASARNPWFVVE
jgi:hypothetical protein